MSHPKTIDRFTIVRQIGSGGMGTVYEAIDPQIDRRVAIKLLRREVLVDNPEVIERLWVEARAANGIRHPGVVPVSEVRLLDDGTGFLVMEYLEGQTLTQKLRAVGGRLVPAEALHIALQMASTLNAGHLRGIIHRDLKPDNIMLVPDDAVSGGERVKLLDFGIAKIAGPTNRAPLTLIDMGLGTPGYMAPEQMRDAISASDRSDVYGLGAVLFELLTGQRPYMSRNTAELVVMVLSHDAPLITSFDATFPPPLAELVARMLKREPAAERPAMLEVLRELASVSASLPAASGRSGGWAVPLSSPSLIVPPTMAGKLDSARLAPPSVVTPLPEPGAAAPSASTISQMTGQASAAAAPRPEPRRLLISAVASLCTGGLIFLLLWSVQGRSGTPPASHQNYASKIPGVSPVVSPTPTPAAPPPLTPIPKPDDKGNGAALHVDSEVKPKATSPDANCVKGAGLSLGTRRAIAGVLAKANIKLLPGEDVYLIRQGASLEVSAMPAHVSSRQEMNVVRMLGTALSTNSLPSGLAGVHVRCTGK